MSNRLRVNITLTAKARAELEVLAKHQLRSRSHAIETLIDEAYQQMQNQKGQTK